MASIWPLWWTRRHSRVERLRAWKYLDLAVACACRELPMSAVPTALVNRDTRGFMNIVAKAGTRRIPSATVVAAGAGDVTQAAVYAVQFGLPTDHVATYLTLLRDSNWQPRSSGAS